MSSNSQFDFHDDVNKVAILVEEDLLCCSMCDSGLRLMCKPKTCLQIQHFYML